MSSDKNDKLKGHEYDGIQEYDNDLPNWWLVTFYLTLAFGFLYWTKYYVFTDAPPQEAAYRAELEKHQAMVAEKTPRMEDLDFKSLVKDTTVLAQGKSSYTTYCTPCHGENGEGGIGPNLTDAHWIHGYKPKDIVRIVTEGVPDKGMTPWKGILSPTQINEVAAYVLSLEGKEPRNAKAPQGEIIKG